jgi:hypothetical protein
MMTLPAEAAEIYAAIDGSGLGSRARRAIIRALGGRFYASARSNQAHLVSKKRLAALTEADLLAQRNCGKVSAKEAMAWLDFYCSRPTSPAAIEPLETRYHRLKSRWIRAIGTYNLPGHEPAAFLQLANLTAELLDWVEELTHKR